MHLAGGETDACEQLREATQAWFKQHKEDLVADQAAAPLEPVEHAAKKVKA